MIKLPFEKVSIITYKTFTMDSTYLITHVIMLICIFTIISSSVDFAIDENRAEKGKASFYRLNKNRDKIKADFKEKKIMDHPAEFQPDNNKNLTPKLLRFRYDMRRLFDHVLF